MKVANVLNPTTDSLFHTITRVNIEEIEKYICQPLLGRFGKSFVYILQHSVSCYKTLGRWADWSQSTQAKLINELITDLLYYYCWQNPIYVKEFNRDSKLSRKRKYGQENYSDIIAITVMSIKKKISNCQILRENHEYNGVITLGRTFVKCVNLLFNWDVIKIVLVGHRKGNDSILSILPKEILGEVLKYVMNF